MARTPQNDWIYELYVKELISKHSHHKVSNSINQADIKHLPQTNNNGKSESDRKLSVV